MSTHSMTRRWCLVAGILALGSTGSLEAQFPAMPDSLVQSYRADFAVPDAPALTLLDLDGSALVRPSTVRELSVALSDFTSGGSLQLPKAAAVEFSPGLLFFGRRLKLSDYQRKAALYRLRISVATRRTEGSGSPTSVALAIRTSFKDAADLRDPATNSAFLAQARSLVDSAANIDAAAEDAAADSGGIDAPVVYTPRQQRALDALITRFKNLNTAYADSAWNRTAFDAAIGLRADAADSAGRDIAVQQYSAWLSYATGVRSWGQFVIGAQMASERDSTDGKFGVTGTGALRFYAGSNKQKVYLDLQASKHKDLDTEYLLGGGAEVGVGRGFWVVMSVGRQWGGAEADGKFRARFAFKSALPMR